MININNLGGNVSISVENGNQSFYKNLYITHCWAELIIVAVY